MNFQIKTVERQFNIIGIFSAFSFSWDDSFVFNGESHDLWEIVFITDGEVEVVEDGNVYFLRAGDMILHAPYEFHRIRSKSGNRPEGCVMTFKATGDLPSELKSGIFMLTDSQRNEYLSVFGNIKSFMRAGNDSPYAGQLAADALASFLIRLSTHTSSASVSASASSDEYRKIVSTMELGVREGLTLADISERQSVSISYIKLLFKKYAGISPKAYYTKLRIQHAARLLAEGYTVVEISLLMNFSSPNYFSAYFKKHTGSSPSRYKP